MFYVWAYTVQAIYKTFLFSENDKLERKIDTLEKGKTLVLINIFFLKIPICLYLITCINTQEN